MSNNLLSSELEKKLLGNNLGVQKNSPLHRLFIECYQNAGIATIPYDLPLLKKLAGVSLYIKQQKREYKDFVYSNDEEMQTIEALNVAYPINRMGGYEYDENTNQYVLNEKRRNFRDQLLDEIKNSFYLNQNKENQRSR